MNRKRPYYQSYLLRLWRSGHDENAPWRFMLENPHTGERHSFASLEEMIVFLQQTLVKQESESWK